MSQNLNPLDQPIGPPMPDWQAPPVPLHEAMQGRFCRLEPLDADRHTDSLYDAYALDAEGRMWTYLSRGPFAAREDYRAWMKDVCSRTDPLYYAIIDLATGRATGVASYMRIDAANGCIEVGNLAFSPLLQRKPAATEAMYLMMKHAFELGYRRYEWKCDALNVPSRDAAMRLGFSFEGTFRQAVVYKGHSRDTAWFSVIDQEWLALQDTFEHWLAPANFDERGNQRSRLSNLTGIMLKPRG